MRRYSPGFCSGILALFMAILHPGTLSASCEQGTALDVIDDRIDRAGTAIGKSQLGEAANLLELAYEGHLCSREALPLETLHGLYISLGALYLHPDRGEGNQGNAYLTMATDIHPGGEWSPWLRGNGEQSYRTLQIANRARPRTQLRLAQADALRGRSIALDGTLLGPETVLSLLPGTHLLQVQEAPEVWASQQITVPRADVAYLTLDEGERASVIPGDLFLRSEDRDALLYLPPHSAERPHRGQVAAWRTSVAFLGGAALAAGGFFYTRQQFREGHCDPNPAVLGCEEWITRGHVAAGLAWGLGGAALTSGAAALLTPRLQEKRNRARSEAAFTLSPGPGDVGLGLSRAF